jgi:hypothetical protein
MKRCIPTAALACCLLSVAPAGAVNCPTIQRPVCGAGTDGHRSNLPNACLAQQKGYKVLHDGSCEAPDPVSACSHLVSPICALDPATGKERTYPNMCAAEVATAQSVHAGTCAVLKPSG